MADKALCSIPGCGKPRHQCGYCNAHHRRWWRYGDPLAGSTHLGEPAAFLEKAIATEDRDACMIWPYGTRRGYARISIDGRSAIVARLVCERIHGPAPSVTHQAAHLCGKGSAGCINPHHLVWKTPVDNCADKVRHGTSLRGERCARAKLTEADVRKIKRLISDGRISKSEIARTYGVSATAISLIQTGQNWGWLE